MPSSNKTGHLGLNKWLGTDKPKKDDFNSDNQKLDAALQNISSLYTAMHQSQNLHAGDKAVHVTAAERAAWNAKDQFAIGSYQGNGALSRKIEAGFRPRFGLLFAAGKPTVSISADSGSADYYFACFMPAGSAEGVSVDGTGFTVTNHSSGRPSGMSCKFNENGLTYVYLLLR